MHKQETPAASSLGSALRNLFENLGISRKIREYDAVVRWGEMVGEKIAGVTEAVKIEKGVLVVRVQNGPWRNELNLLKKDIIEKINTGLGETLVRDIKFV